MAEIENISISIGAGADAAFVAFDRLISKLNRTKIELKAFAAGAVVSGLKEIKDNANGAASALNRYAKAQERANRAASGYSGGGYTSTMRSAASDTDKATNAIVRFVSAMATAQSAMQRMRGANAFRNNISFAPMQPQLTGEVDEPIITHFVDDIDDGMAHVESSTQSARFSLMSFLDALFGFRDSNIPATLHEIGKGFKDIGKSLIAIPSYFGKQLIGNISESVKGMEQFLSSIKRIAMYRLIRTALKEITKGISEGFKHLYNWSKTADHTFANSMNRIATAAQYMGNSFAAMASPLVEAISPAIDFIADKFVDLFNLINQIIARLSGATSYTAARKVSAQWEDASKKASGSAKKAADEIKRTLLGFDEINKLNDPNKSSGSGGGGSGSGSSGAGMFETRTIDSAVSSFADQLKAAFEASDWQGLGTLLGNKVNEIVDKIDFASAGKKVGTYINGWFSTKYWTLDTINFTNIGGKIAEFLNNAISKIDFNIIGRSVVQKMTIIGDSVIGFFTNFDWKQAATKISNFVSGLYDEIGKWFAKYDWTKVGKALGEGLANFIAGIDYVGLAKSMYTALSNALTAGIGTLTGFFDGLASKFKAAINWNALSEGVQQGISGVMAVLGLATGVIGAILAFSGANVPLGIGMMIAGGIATGTSLSLMWNGLSDKVKSNIELIKGILFGASLAIGAVLTFSGANIPLGLGLMVSGAAGLAGTVGTNWNVIKEKLQGPIGAATALISGATLLLGVLCMVGGNYGLGLGLILAGSAGLASTVAAEWENMKALGALAIQKFKDGWDSLTMDALKIPVQLALTAEELWAGLKIGWIILQNKVLEIGVAIAQTAQDIWDGITDGWNKLANTSLDIALGISTTIAELWNQIVEWWDEFTSGKWLGIKIGIGDGSGKVDTSPSDAYDSGAWAYATSINVGVNGIAGKLMKVVGGKLAPDTTNTNTTNTVKGGVGAGMKSISGKFAPIVSNTSTTNTVKGAAGSGMKSVSGKYTPVVSNTTTTNTVKAAAGAGVKASGKSYVVSMANTKTSNEVYAVAGVGMVKLSGTNKYSIKAVDTKTKDTVNGASGAGMYYDKNAKAFKPYVAGTTTKNTINGSSGTGMGYDKNNGKFKPKVENTSSTVSVKKGWTGAVLDKLGLSNLSATIKVGLKVDKKRSKAVITGDTGSIYTVSTRGEKAKGGIFSNGVWSNIPQYAGGTANAHGSLFLAGEAGPEIVGHVGGRTEVLNKSQLASAMFSAVQAAMAPAAANFAAAASNMSTASVGIDLETLAEMVRQGVEQAMSRSNDYDRQKVELLRSINEKDNTIEVSTSSINRAQTRMNRRAGTTIVAVGT